MNNQCVTLLSSLIVVSWLRGQVMSVTTELVQNTHDTKASKKIICTCVGGRVGGSAPVIYIIFDQPISPPAGNC